MNIFKTTKKSKSKSDVSGIQVKQKQLGFFNKQVMETPDLLVELKAKEIEISLLRELLDAKNEMIKLLKKKLKKMANSNETELSYPCVEATCYIKDAAKLEDILNNDFSVQLYSESGEGESGENFKPFFGHFFVKAEDVNNVRDQLHAKAFESKLSIQTRIVNEEDYL
jgi:hypothetical protein